MSRDWCVESDWSTGFDDDDRNLHFGQIRGLEYMRAINMEFMPFLMKFSSFDLSSYDLLSLSLPLSSGLSPSFSFLLNPY